jgi:hypothetical protein
MPQYFIGQKHKYHEEHSGSSRCYSKEVNLEINAKKTKQTSMLFRHVGRSHNVKIADRSFETVEKLRYLGTTVTNKSYIIKEIKNRLNWSNACYRSIQYLLSSHIAVM